MSLTAKLAAAILSVALLAVALIGTLNYAYVTRTYLDLASERFSFVLYDLKGTIENLGLGVELADLRLLQDILEREKVRDDQILSIEVFDPAGMTLFSTDRGSIGDAVPEEWLRARGQTAAGATWRVVEHEAIVMGVPIVNDFDLVIGQVALSYSLGYYESRIADIASRLGTRYAAVLILLVPLLTIAAFLALRGTRRAFARMEQLLIAMRDPAADPAVAANDATLQPVFRRMAGRTAEALGDIRRATRDVQRLDDAI